MTSAAADPHLDDAANAVARRLDGRSVAVAESCTAGRIATALAGVEHAADFLRGGVTAYQDDVKRGLLGVDAPTVLCEAAVVEMADGVAALLGADVGVATSGVAGLEPVDGVEPGTIFVATRVDGATRATTLHIDAHDPHRICDRAARRALRLLADHLAEAGRR